MKKKQIKNIYHIVAVILFMVGLFFTYIIAEIDDAPGFIFLGTAITTLFCLLLFGLGSLIDVVKSNNEILTDIYKELKNKKK
jgi:hypothetical protein